MMDERADPESTAYRKPTQPPEWDKSVSPLDYFLRAFELGFPDHPEVQRMRTWYEKSYVAAKEEHERLKALEKNNGVFK